MTLTERERAELDQLVALQAADLEYLSGVEARYPLAMAPLWAKHGAPCDQRRAVAGVMRSPTVGIVLGGWRSGKSEGLKHLAIASALGSGHPAVQLWLELNGLPLDTIPEHPSQVYAIAQASNDSIRYHRPDFDRLAPGGTWYGRNSKGEALYTLPVPGTKQQGKIWFKSMDQGRRAFQGISIRFAWIDEEPLGDDGYGVYDELRARVADQEGRIGISMAPLEGLTWVWERLVRDHEDDARIFELDTLDNPHLPPASFQRLFAGMGEDELAQRRFGRFVSKSGRVYGLFAEGDGSREGPGHTCEPFEVPADWPRFRGHDWGLDNPTVCLWVAIGDDGTHYVYREHFDAGPTYEEHARIVHDLEVGESIECGWGDPANPDAIRTFREADVHLHAADAGPGSVRAGIDAIRDLLRLRADNRPRLKVFRTCRNTIREFRGYVWDTNRKDEVPVKKNDHAMDALRYAITGIESWNRI